jgi:hypothetical protein
MSLLLALLAAAEPPPSNKATRTPWRPQECAAVTDAKPETQKTKRRRTPTGATLRGEMSNMPTRPPRTPAPGADCPTDDR